MEVVRPQPSVPALPLGGFMPNNEVIQIRDIQGLGPVKSEVAKAPYATGRGELFQGSSTGTRNIVLSLGLNPNWAEQTMVSLRQLLYRYFMPETWATLRFFSDELPVVGIRGVVESFEPNLFSSDPEVQISILCPKPDFIDLATTLITGTTSATPLSVAYMGTAPSGFQLRIEAAYSGNLAIINQLPDTSQQKFNLTSVVIDSSKRFEMNTVRSLRYVYNVLTGGEDAVNILAKMDKTSDWPEFLPGTNALTISAGVTGLAWELAYFNRFGGL
jgi:hypothetical protein